MGGCLLREMGVLIYKGVLIDGDGGLHIDGDGECLFMGGAY